MEELFISELKSNLHVKAIFESYPIEDIVTKNILCRNVLIPYYKFEYNLIKEFPEIDKTTLEIDYNKAIRIARLASNWKKSLKLIRLYPNVRLKVGLCLLDEHKACKNIILPFDHVFYDTHLPPNAIGCLCSFEFVDDDINTLPENLPIIEDMFKFHVAKY